MIERSPCYIDDPVGVILLSGNMNDGKKDLVIDEQRVVSLLLVR